MEYTNGMSTKEQFLAFVGSEDEWKSFERVEMSQMDVIAELLNDPEIEKAVDDKFDLSSNVKPNEVLNYIEEAFKEKYNEICFGN